MSDTVLFGKGVEDYDDEEDYDYRDEWNDDAYVPNILDIYHSLAIPFDDDDDPDDQI